MLFRVVMALQVLALAACSAPSAPASSSTIESPQTEETTKVDLGGIKNYLVEQSTTLAQATAKLKDLSNQYYDTAKQAAFDYGKLWGEQSPLVLQQLEAARAAWIEASPLYEKMEGIVAGTPTLADYDMIIDAGASAADDPENAVPFDLTLPDGRVFPKPGNLFGVTESALWGTFADYTVKGVVADFNNNGTVDFGEALPDANLLKAAAETLDQYANQLHTRAESWTPTTTDAFTALVTMVPTMNEYFASWRDSRFVAGAASTQRDFVAISRLSDMQDILGGLEVIYQNVQPLTVGVDQAQGKQIASELSGLRAFVGDVYQQELAGKKFSAEEADSLGAEAQNRASSITGQISQMAGLLGIEL